MDSLDWSEFEAKLRSFLVVDHLHKVFTPNAEILLEGRRDPVYRDCLNQGDLNIPDGVSILFANRLIHFLNKFSAQLLNTKVDQKIKNRLPGVDALELLCSIATAEGKRVLFFGAGPGVAERAAQMMAGKYPGLVVKGIDPGPVDLSSTMNIDSIKDFAPDIMAVALGHGKQERFICSVLPTVPSVKIAIGIGGALDYISGNVRRAPMWMRRLGLEWLYRLIREPRRIKRIFNAVVVFPLAVILDRIKAL